MWASASRSSVASTAVSVVPIPASAAVARDHVADRGVGVVRSASRSATSGSSIGVGVQRLRAVIVEPARDLAGGGAADAVGDREQAGTGVQRVLVFLALHADVAAAAEAPAAGSRASSSTLRPILIRLPTGTTTGSVTFVSPTNVPLVEPTSSTSQSWPRGTSRAWLFET